MLTGDMTGVDSTARRNTKERHIHPTPNQVRKKMGVRADLIWRTLLVPAKDWAIGEAAKTWDDQGQKYKQESSFKLPRQLHDVLVARSMESSTIHLIDVYDRAKDQRNKERRQDRHQGFQFEQSSSNEADNW
ncbi:hypothetical protein BGZ98_004036, partial [Dissophora globulifera]